MKHVKHHFFESVPKNNKISILNSQVALQDINNLNQYTCVCTLHRLNEIVAVWTDVSIQIDIILHPSYLAQMSSHNLSLEALVPHKGQSLQLYCMIWYIQYSWLYVLYNTALEKWYPCMSLGYILMLGEIHSCIRWEVYTLLMLLHFCIISVW